VNLAAEAVLAFLMDWDLKQEKQKNVLVEAGNTKSNLIVDILAPEK
jgi:hypothetical protein